MENHKLIKKLMENTNIQYEDAKIALEENNYNVLDATLYLELNGKIEPPHVRIYFTNKFINSNEEILALPNTKSSGYYNEDAILARSEYKNKSVIEKIFEFIERCNNVFVEISTEGKIYIRFPLMAVLILLAFCFWVIVPSIIVALFFDVQFSLSGDDIGGSKDFVNNFFSDLSKKARGTRKNIKVRHKKE